MTNTDRTSPSQAKIRHTRSPGWIWAVPIAALGITIWLLVRAMAQGGTDITIAFNGAYGMDPNHTDIMYLGKKIGSVNGIELADDGNSVEVSAKIEDSASKFLNTGTVFWLRGARPDLSNPSSLSTIFSGPKIVMQPGSGTRTTHFKGVDHKPLPVNHGAPVLFTAYFEGTVGELRQGDTVEVRGFPVGEVKQIGFHFDLKTGKLASPITLALYPELFHVDTVKLPESPEAFKAVISRLIQQGLRARLDRQPPLIGSYQVTLEMVPEASTGRLQVIGGLPEIPTAPGGGLESIATRLKNIPVEQIGQHVLEVAKHADAIVSSPGLKNSIAELEASLREVRGVVNDVGPKVDNLVETLNNTAETLSSTARQLEQTAKAANRTIGGVPTQTGLQDTLREMKQAARAVRSLADYLDRHPEALISGKPGG